MSVLRNQGHLIKIAANRIREQESIQIREEWRRYLRDYRLSGKRIRMAILPHLDDWLDRRHGCLTFRMTQLLTGHGCFSTFLARIQKINTNWCFHCNLDVDSPEHTLGICPTFLVERNELIAVIGPRISLRDYCWSIVRTEVAWTAFSTFAERVLTKKEEAERTRELEARAVIPIDLRIDQDDDSD